MYYDLLLVLPCSKAPPAAPIGGWSWYGKAETTYKCPNGHEFLDGSYPNSSANCNLLKQWEPDEQMECQGKDKGSSKFIWFLKLLFTPWLQINYYVIKMPGHRSQ